MKWTDQETQFLKDNHLKMSPEEMAEHLPDRSSNKVKSKMHRDGIRFLSVVYNIQNRLFMGRLIKLGMHQEEIAELTGLTVETIRYYALSVSRITEINRKQRVKPKHRAFHYDAIKIINSAGFSDFKVDYEEDERFRYVDLTPSEKLIYHGLQTQTG